MPSQRLQYLLLVAAVSMAAMFAYGRIDPTDARYAVWDLHDYRMMAQAAPSLTFQARQPFVFRILGPYIAGLLPLSTDSAFLALTLTAGLALPLLLYLCLCVPPRSLDRPAAAFAVIAFILNKYLFGFSIWNYFQVNDLLAQIELLCLLWALGRQRWLVFGILLVLGSLTKEVTLLAIPVAAVYIRRMESEKPWRPFLAAIAPGLLVAAAARVLIQADQGNSLSQAFLEYSHKVFSPETWVRLLINAFIPFSIVPLIFWKSTKEYFRTRVHELVLFVLIVCSTFFGYNNERLMGPAFVVFFPLLGFLAQREFARPRVLLPVMYIAVVLSIFHHTYARFPLPREWTIPLSLSALAGVTLISIFRRIQDQPTPDSR